MKRNNMTTQKKQPKQEGTVIVWLVLLVIILLGVFGYFYFQNKNRELEKMSQTIIDKDKPVLVTKTDNGVEETFPDLPSDDNMPKEVSNEAIQEIDSIMTSIDNDTVSDLNDLE